MCCSRVSPDASVQARIEDLLHQPLDWESVIKRSWWHRVRPLTYVHLRAQPPGLVPDKVLAELAIHAQELAERNQRLLRALHDVSELFESSGLRLLVFKGPSLTLDAYGDLSLRECGDLDLLLHGDDFASAAELLKSHGFASWWDRDDSKSVRQVFACEFERDGVTLDVHWDLAPGWLNYQLDFDRFWEGGLPVLDGSHFARKVSPEDSIVVLCIHGTKHWWERLRWICDMAELVNSGRVVDWDRVEEQALKSHSRRSVYLGLWLAGNLLEARLPKSIRQRVDATPTVRRMGLQVAVWLGHAETASESRTLRDRFIFRMGASERMRDRVRQLIHYLLARPSDDD